MIKNRMSLILLCVSILSLTANLVLFMFISTKVQGENKLIENKENAAPVEVTADNSSDIWYSERIPKPGKDDIEIVLHSESKTITSSIEENGEEFKFVFNYKPSFWYRYHKNISGEIYTSEDSCFSIVDIDIINIKTNEIIQTLNFEAFNINGISSFYNNHVPSWEIVDFNFDGYQDILCLRSIDGYRSNAHYVGWLWNPDKKQFEEANIGGITNLSVDAKNERLTSQAVWTAVHRGFEIYRYIDGDFIQTNQLDIGGIYDIFDGNGNAVVNYYIQDNDYLSVEEWELINGERVDVFPTIFTNDDEGIKILEEHLYGPNSIWF